ncbi:MAG TPA: hypothetical protein VNS58_27840 [Puia sp.]|nr:hypothetical protein [Puia sp.]
MSKSTKSGPKKSEEDIQKSLDEMDYSGKDDIYSRDKEEDLDLDGGLKKTKKAKKTPKDMLSEDELDVPGADLDDDEAVGEEDEENSYYSLGGDDHDDLEETNDDNV